MLGAWMVQMTMSFVCYITAPPRQEKDEGTSITCNPLMFLGFCLFPDKYADAQKIQLICLVF